MCKKLLLTVLIVLAAGCSESDRQGARTGPTSVPLQRLPAGALGKCESSLLLRPACPTRIPAAPYDPQSAIYDARLSRQFPSRDAHTFNLQWGCETPGRPERNRPPRMVHLLLVAGAVEPVFPVGVHAEPRDGLMHTKRRVGLDLGSVRWSGRSGRLILAPPVPFGGVEGNHVIFNWREGGIDYRLSLHAWEPFMESVATLRATVGSLPQA
jgi:hypothetical protein